MDYIMIGNSQPQTETMTCGLMETVLTGSLGVGGSISAIWPTPLDYTCSMKQKATKELYGKLSSITTTPSNK